MRRLATAVETCHIVADKLFSHARDFALKVLNCQPHTCRNHHTGTWHCLTEHRKVPGSYSDESADIYNKVPPSTPRKGTSPLIEPQQPSVQVTTGGRLSHNTLVLLWTHSRISPESRMSRSESSLLEEQTQEKRPSCSESVIPRRVQGSTGLVNGGIVSWYVFDPSGMLNLII
jgi:hypothetical protein